MTDLVPRQPDATPAAERDLTTAPKGPSRMTANQDRAYEARIQALIDQEQHDDDHEPGCASQSYPDPGICYCEKDGAHAYGHELPWLPEGEETP